MKVIGPTHKKEEYDFYLYSIKLWRYASKTNVVKIHRTLLKVFRIIADAEWLVQTEQYIRNVISQWFNQLFKKNPETPP